MARLNVEAKIWADPRLDILVKKMGDRDKALGHLIRFWSVAQQFWKQNESLIPDNIFQLHGFSKHLMTAQLAEKREGGVYAKGAKREFGWLKQRVDAGKKRKKTVEKFSEKKPNKNEEVVEAESKSRLTEAIPPSLPPSLPLTQKQEVLPSVIQPSQSPVRKKNNLPHDFQEVLRTFIREYKNKYGSQYRPSGKDMNLLGLIRKDLGGLGTYDRMVKAYFAMDDQYFLNKRHDVFTLYQNLAKVSHYEQTGVLPSQARIRGIDKEMERAEKLREITKNIKERESNGKSS